MELFLSLCFKTRVSLSLFLLGKLTFLPTIYFLFSGQKFAAYTSMILYSSMIMMSIVLSLMTLKSKTINTSLIVDRIKNSSDCNETFTVVIKDGKVIAVN